LIHLTPLHQFCLQTEEVFENKSKQNKNKKQKQKQKTKQKTKTKTKSINKQTNKPKIKTNQPTVGTTSSEKIRFMQPRV